MIGVHEVPNGSNRGPIQQTRPRGGVDFFQDFDFLVGRGYPWCVSFVLSCWAVGAKRPLPYQTAGAYEMFRWAQTVGWARPSGACAPGDLIVFNVGAGHIAMLESQAGSDVRTIDGNSSNQVRRVVRSRSAVRGGIHIPEEPVKLPPKLVPQPFWVVTTSERGHKRVVLTRFATEKRFIGLLAKLVSRYGINGLTVKRSRKRKLRPA